MVQWVIFAAIGVAALIITALFTAGKFGNRRYRRNLARHPLTPVQRGLALLAVILWMLACVLVPSLDGWTSKLLLVPGPLLAFGVWVLWERDEPEHIG